MTTRLCCAIFLVILSGCAVKNYAYGENAPGAATPAQGKSTVYLVRPGVYGFAIRYPVTINEQAYPSLSAQRFIKAELEPGTVVVKAKGEKMCTVTFTAKSDNAYYLKATNRPGWLYARVQLEMVDPTEGMSYVSQCSAQ